MLAAHQQRTNLLDVRGDQSSAYDPAAGRKALVPASAYTLANTGLDLSFSKNFVKSSRTQNSVMFHPLPIQL